MLGNYFTFPELLIWIPLIAGIISIFIKKSNSVKWFALGSSILVLIVSVISLFYSDPSKQVQNFNYNHVSYLLMPYMGASFSVGLDSLGFIVTLLTALTFPIVFLNFHKRKIENPSLFYSLMLLFECGLMGVFVAYDMLVFYFFWILAFIPAYFLCCIWGGSRRISVGYKSFAYTFVSALLMLAGILYFYQFAPQLNPESVHSFSIMAFYTAHMEPAGQPGIFLLFFFAVAIITPVFPFHSWQPDMFEQSPFASTIVMSSVMTKMGVVIMLRWIVPMVSVGILKYETILVVLSVTGFVYGCSIAWVQDDLKKLVAWASVAQMGLIAAGIFSGNVPGFRGAMFELFNHGINILGLWMVVSIIEESTGTRKISELGGLAKKSPALTFFFMIILLANIGFPFTNSFTSKFLILAGLFSYSKWLAFIACIGIVLSAVYLLKIFRKVFYSENKNQGKPEISISIFQTLAMSVLVLLIIILGIYPDLILHFTNGIAQELMRRMGGINI